jgi:hypothetical protein
MPVEANLHEKNVYDVTNGRKGSADKGDKKAPTATMVRDMSRNDSFLAIVADLPQWYPTLLLNIDFKKSLPEEGVEWLFVRAESKQIKNGRMDIEVIILDEAGDVVALSHHVALAVSAERNVAKRVTGSKI